MKLLLDKSFDFSIRVTELAKYLDEEHKSFPFQERLLACATGIGVCLRQQTVSTKEASAEKALNYVSEAEYLLELLSKTEYLTERQSRPVLEGCRSLKEMLLELSGRQKDSDWNEH